MSVGCTLNWINKYVLFTIMRNMVCKKPREKESMKYKSHENKKRITFTSIQ